MDQMCAMSTGVDVIWAAMVYRKRAACKRSCQSRLPRAREMCKKHKKQQLLIQPVTGLCDR